jgi:predicted RNA binding protein YcfA (HicA-like mRNA interferase family)
MNKHDKRLAKLAGQITTFPWRDVEAVMASLGYKQHEMAGSRVRFFHPQTGHMIRLHRPHPSNELKGGALRDLRNSLKQEGYL